MNWKNEMIIKNNSNKLNKKENKTNEIRKQT